MSQNISIFQSKGKILSCDYDTARDTKDNALVSKESDIFVTKNMGNKNIETYHVN